ncbi:MAG: gas vesicle protein GvpJ [Bacteroidota bacterium]|nr:gas vesicle protein GvpJ [Bacteroidota bacterium]
MAKHPPIKTSETDVISPMGRVPRDEKVTLIDALDKVLEKGAVINGDIVIRVADVDLVFLGLRLILTSISKAEEMSGKSFSNPDKEFTPHQGKLGAGFTPEDIEYIEKLQKEIKRAEENIPKLIDASDPKKTEQGLAQLVLTLVELIRKLMEKEAFRRIKRGTLSPVEIQKLGLSLKAVKMKIKEIQTIFGIEDEELNLDLGPLGNLM